MAERQDWAYTTKSGYAMAKLNSEAEPPDSFDWKKRIWQVNTSPKLRQLLWKATAGALAVGSAIKNRGIDTDAKCKRCGTHETEIHVLLHCPYASRVWHQVPCLHSPASLTQRPNSVTALLDSCSKIINLPPTGLGEVPIFPWVLWTLWTNRNKLLFEDKDFSVEETVLKILQDSRAWKGAQESKEYQKVPQCVDPSLRLPNILRPPIFSISGTTSWSLYQMRLGILRREDVAWDGIFEMIQTHQQETFHQSAALFPQPL